MMTISPIGKPGAILRGGFTLLELLLVVTIMGVLLGFAVPKFSRSLERERLSSAAESVVQAVHFARAEATASRQVWEIVFDENGNEMRVRPRGSKNLVERYLNNKLWRPFSVRVPSGFYLLWDQPVIQFFPDGSSESATVKIMNKNGRALQIDIKEYNVDISKPA